MKLGSELNFCRSPPRPPIRKILTIIDPVDNFDSLWRIDQRFLIMDVTTGQCQKFSVPMPGKVPRWLHFEWQQYL